MTCTQHLTKGRDSEVWLLLIQWLGATSMPGPEMIKATDIQTKWAAENKGSQRGPYGADLHVSPETS